MIGLIIAVKISINNVPTLTFPILIVPPKISGNTIERNVHQTTWIERKMAFKYSLGAYLARHDSPQRRLTTETVHHRDGSPQRRLTTQTTWGILLSIT